jgi:hypothetical protein
LSIVIAFKYKLQSMRVLWIEEGFWLLVLRVFRVFVTIVEYKVRISFLNVVVFDRTIVDLLLDDSFFEWGFFPVYVF